MSISMNRKHIGLWLAALSAVSLLLFLLAWFSPAEATIEEPTETPKLTEAVLIPLEPLVPIVSSPIVAFSLSSLKDELDNDPQGFGYAGQTDFEASNTLNLFRVTEVITRTNITTRELQGEVVTSEYLSLSIVQRDLWTSLLLSGADGTGIDISDLDAQTQMGAVWVAGTSTRNNLIGLQTRDGTRAEALWGEGFSISKTQVEEARLLP